MSYPAEIETPWRIYAGDDGPPLTVTLVENGAPMDLSGWTGWRAQWRRDPRGQTAVELTVDASAAAAGQIAVLASALQSRSITSDGVWDLEGLTPDGQRRTLVVGRIAWVQDVTRDA